MSEKFNTTPEGCKEAKAYLEEQGVLGTIDGARTSGWELVDIANNLWNKNHQEQK